MFILKTGHQPGVYVPLRALFLVIKCFLLYHSLFSMDPKDSVIMRLSCNVHTCI